jgi:hypothetical protein
MEFIKSIFLRRSSADSDGPHMALNFPHIYWNRSRMVNLAIF